MALGARTGVVRQRRNSRAGGLALASALCLAASCRDLPADTFFCLGVNLAGAEFGTEAPGYSNASPGQHGEAYIFPSKETVRWFADRGLKVLRLPLAWERLQPEPAGPLEPTYTQRVLEFLDLAQLYDGRVVLDLHAYGRYRMDAHGDVQELVVGDPLDPERGVMAEHLADLWIRVAARVHDHPALLAYGLMNEPHDMGGADWHATSSEVVRALRAAGDRNWIWVAGDGWSKASEWGIHNPQRPWVDDPLERTAYEAHVYFDADSSGRYMLSYSDELTMDPDAAARGRQRLEPFAAWCERNGVRGVVGEFGVPWYDEGWLPVLDDFLTAVQTQGMTACAWAGGDWWGDYPLSLQSRGGREVAPLRAMLQRVPAAGH